MSSTMKIDAEIAKNEEIEVLQQVELSDDEDDGYKYEAVSEDSGNEYDDEDENLAAAIASLTKKEKPEIADERITTHVRPAVIDDFIRKFLTRVKMTRTLECFNTEWYELQSKGKLNEEYTNPVPDIYLRNIELDENVHVLREELAKMKEITEKAQGTWDKFRKERDFHRMHHKRVVIEKNKLITDLRRLQKHFDSYEPTLKELQAKYKTAMKEKMLMRLERDRLKARTTTLEDQVGQLQEQQMPLTAEESFEEDTSPKKKKKKDSPIPVDHIDNPFTELEFDAALVGRYTLKKTFRGHLNAVSCVAFHPKKPIIATTSDDETWKLWVVPNCDLIMSGEGHKDWVSGIDFHPYGTHIATSSGDATVKLWDFSKATCTYTIQDHTQAVWGCKFHYTGDFLASCSMDHTARIFDLNSQRVRQTLRGHVDSVNSLCWQPYSNNLCTGSGDKTVSLWDIRSGLCVQTFYGHLNAVNNITINLKGDTIASCDADGVVKLWDIRKVSEICTMEDGTHHPINSVSFDRSGMVIAAACDDGNTKLFDTTEQKFVSELKGHEDAVQTVAFDPSDKFLVTGSSDCTFRIWS